MGVSDLTIYSTRTMAEGAGARVNRAFPTPDRDHLDPFVLFDEFYVGDDGFPEHPHEGFEIITYMLEGGFEHADSTGASETVGAGGAQRLRVGSGIRHSELPSTDGTDRGLQLWINLPRDRKDTAPDYRDAGRDDLPSESRDGLTVTTVVGEGSPLDLVTDVRYEVAEAEPGSTYEWTLDGGWSGVLYVAEGAVTIPDGDLASGAFAARDGRDRESADPLAVEVNVDDTSRFAAIGGRALDEPIQQRGSVVL